MRLPALHSLRARRAHRPASTRLAVTAVSLAAAASLAVPTVADAAPAPTAPGAALPAPAPGLKADRQVLDSLGAFAPAIIGAVATKGPDGKINPQLVGQARALAATPGLPPQVKEIWGSVIDFLGAPGEKATAAANRQLVAEKKKKGDPEIPKGPNAPRIQEFLYPTLGFGCMEGNGSPNGGISLGRALLTAGPQQAPAPGPKRGEAGYVYTSLGTGPAVNSTARPLWVTWLNIDTGRSGQIPLKRNAKINATDGPGTFTGIAKTGRGRIISTIYGDVTTKNKGRVQSCGIVPTIGIAIV